MPANFRFTVLLFYHKYFDDDDDDDVDRCTVN